MKTFKKYGRHLSIKMISCLIILLAINNLTTAQNVGINATGATPDNTAMLDIVSTSKGLLIPRVALTATNVAGPITTPTTSLLVYNTATAGTVPNNVVAGYYYWDGASWVALLTSTNTGWTLTGNGGTTAGTNFLGTTDAVDLVFTTNSIEKARITSGGNVGIGTSSFNVTNPEKLVVDVGTTSSVNAIVGKGTNPSYLQLNIQNLSNGAGASSDVVATADNGNETTNFIDMGINSSTNASGVMGGANDAYLYNVGQNLLIGTGTVAKSLSFLTGGTAQGTNERMRIDGTSGFVGLGTSAPSYRLDVNGTIRTGKSSTTNGSLVFSNGTNANTVTFNSGTTSASYALSLPTAQGAASTILTNNGSGGLSWNTVAAVGGAWSTLGNSGTTPSTNFLGTIDNQALVLKVNNAAVERFETNAVAIGLAATTNNSTNAYAIGSSATVGFNHPNSYTIGNSSAANSDNAFAIGNGAVVNGTNAFAIGNSAASNSINSIAIGNNSLAAYSITDGIALGGYAAANANNSIAIGGNSVSGSKTQTNGVSSIALGTTAASNSVNGIAIGTSATVAYSITEGIAIGTNALANSNNSIAIGGNITAASKTLANAASAIALGVTAVASSANSIAIGSGATVAFGLTNPIAIGNAASVSGSNGVSIGNGATISSVANATAIGGATSVTGNNSTAIGDDATVSGSNSTAVGYNTDVTQNNAIILGDLTNSNISVGIGSQTFNSSGNREKLLVDMGTTSSVNAIVGRGTNPSYLQLNIQNLSNGNGASSDVVATADNGNETSNFIDMGINSSTNSSGVMGGFNDGYIYNLGQNLLMGTGSANKSLVFMTGGTTQGTNERMRIDGSGNVGIGKNNPSQKLDVVGNFNLVGDFRPGGSAGNVGEFLISTGANSSPVWFNANSYAWLVGGNATAANQNFGTTSNFDVQIISNNTERIHVDNTGSIGIGTATFNATNPEKFVVDVGSTTSVNAIVGKGTNPSYLQLNIQNLSNGVGASSDVVATADNGNETSNFIDMGINSSGNTSGVMGQLNDGYLYNLGQNLLIGTGTAAKSLVFMTGGTAQSTNERMRIDGAGNVGVSTTSPNSTLDVNGSTGASIVTTSTNITLDATAATPNHTVILTGGTPIVTLPAAAASNARRMYVIVNQTGTPVAISSYKNFSGSATLTVPSTSSITIQSDGANWYRIQ